MNFGWESEKEKMLRYMRLSPKKKLKWLQDMHDFFVAMATPRSKKFFWRLRGIK